MSGDIFESDASLAEFHRRLDAERDDETREHDEDIERVRVELHKALGVAETALNLVRARLRELDELADPEVFEQGPAFAFLFMPIDTQIAALRWHLRGTQPKTGA